jgi:sugar lactone lactonase YvrE
VTTTCLLCPSPAVADGLCVDDGARLWAANLWTRDMHEARRRVNGARSSAAAGDAREAAVCEIDGPHLARAFLDKFEAAKAARAVAPVCPRGCKSHDSEEGR